MPTRFRKIVSGRPVRWTLMIASLMVGLLWLGTGCVWIRYLGSKYNILVRRGVVLASLSTVQERAPDFHLTIYYVPSGLSFTMPYSQWGTFHFPLWIPSAGLLAAAVLSFRLKPPPPPPGHCRRCGYDLTGNVSGTCPECGIPAKA